MTTGLDFSALLIQVATMFVQMLPTIVACIVGFALLVGRMSGDPSRRRAMTGLALIAGAVVAQLLVGVTQMMMFQQQTGDGIASLQSRLAVLQGVRFVIECVSAVGLVMIVAALCTVLRGTSQAAASPPPLLPPQ